MRRSAFANPFERLTGAFDRLPIRTRLAGVSALLTFVILCGFAVVVGSLTVHRLRSDFNRQVTQTAEQLSTQLTVYIDPSTYHIVGVQPPLNELPVPEHSVIKLYTIDGTLITQSPVKAPALGAPSVNPATVNGYRVVSRPSGPLQVAGTRETLGQVIVQYGRRVSDVEPTVARVELLLLVGVFAGAGFALLAGMTIARRAMAPIAQLTVAAAEIAQTRDPSRSVPVQKADDEVAELAHTLEGMLRALDAAHAETEAMLLRQRRFVADASHELRTPLTSVLANLELLAESLHGEQGEAATSALRSSRRMRRLVADLLLLARSDVGRVVAHEPCDLAQIVVEAAAELGPVSDSHEIALDVQTTPVEGARDELHRLAINLLENALRHTPPGTEIRVRTRSGADGAAQLVVEDDGPGVPEELAGNLFERFVRGAGDRGGSFGLGLAIVRAVAESHGGSVALDPAYRAGARFIVRLPGAGVRQAPRPQQPLTQTTPV
ncbi:MAG TPA: HAMP domain-containing sensor histidine kinase [Solirubrobacteraceae bacterium]|jgi:signal transduction histidine kinase